LSAIQSIKFLKNFAIWLSIGLLFLAGLPARAQNYVWQFKYLQSDKTNHWRHLAAGDTLAIASLKFGEIVSAQYRLTQFGVRPLTDCSTWFINEIQLWKDNGDKKFSTIDTFQIALDLNEDLIIPQTLPTNSISTPADIQLSNNQMFFIVSVVPNWHDSNPENLEIDTSAAGPDGVLFSVDELIQDLVVTPEVPNNLIGDTATAQYFSIQAKNLPVTVRNSTPTSAEDDSVRLNMFYANFNPRSSSSKTQRINDLEFTADVYLLSQDSDSGLIIESAGFDFGYDNSILSLASIEPGNVWREYASYYVSDTLYLTSQTIPGQPNYVIYHCEMALKNCLTDTTTWRQIKNDTATVARLNFKVLKPGVSPIFIQNEDLRDQFGIRYHTYRKLQNYANPDYSPTSDRYDAWVKYILGDWADSDLNEIGDGQVTIEDITLFSNYIWLGRNDPAWYDRFDIGSPFSHDPDEIDPDDTTNFYDLLVVARNYNRTYNGAFLQKNLVRNQPHKVILSRVASTGDASQTQFVLKISNTAQVNAVHARLHFEPQPTALLKVTALSNSEHLPLLLYPPDLVKKGILDIYLFKLGGTLGIDDRIFQVELQSQKGVIPTLILNSLNIFGDDWNSREYQIGQSQETALLPVDMDLLASYPNPFNNATRIDYWIGPRSAGQVSLIVYDLRGRRVKILTNQPLESGRYSLIWNGSDENGIPLGSGTYFLKLTTPGHQHTQKIILLR